jgi:hypothetical protein
MKKFDAEGNFTDSLLSSTRQTRDAALHQIVRKAQVILPTAKGRRG